MVRKISLKGRLCLAKDGVGLCDMRVAWDMPVIVGREWGVA